MRSGYTSLPTEHEYEFEASEVEGAVPRELVGTLFRNGPGLMEVQGTPLNQPFDGDGMICRFTFDGSGRVTFKNRFVRTAGYVAEQSAGRMLFKGAFATGKSVPGFFNPFNFDVKNVANTNVVLWGRRLWALWEAALPHEMDPRSLATLGGESSWDGAISGKGPFAAHYKVVPDANGAVRLINFGSAVAGTDAEVTVYEFDERAALVRKCGVKLPNAAFGFFHDCLVTPNHVVLFANPVSLNPAKLLTQYMFGQCSIAECLTFDPAGSTRAFVIPRSGRVAEMKTFTLPAHFVFHHVNAYESDDGAALVCDSVAWRSIDFSVSLNELSGAYYGAGPPSGAGSQRSELYRTTLNLVDGSFSRSRTLQRPIEFPAVAPSVAGRPHQHAYAAGAAIDHPVLWGPAQTLVKLSAPQPGGVLTEAAVWAPGARCFTQEPVFVARPGATTEDDGWLLSLMFDAAERATKLVILDARSMKPVASIRLRHVVPFGLHGSWTEEVLQ